MQENAAKGVRNVELVAPVRVVAGFLEIRKDRMNAWTTTSSNMITTLNVSPMGVVNLIGLATISRSRGTWAV